MRAPAKPWAWVAVIVIAALVWYYAIRK